MTDSDRAPVPELLERIDAMAAEREWLVRELYTALRGSRGPTFPPALIERLAHTERDERYWRTLREHALTLAEEL